MITVMEKHSIFLCPSPLKNVLLQNAGILEKQIIVEYLALKNADNSWAINVKCWL
jgi:hypothetical protein